jgi:hypothetical protein
MIHLNVCKATRCHSLADWNLTSTADSVSVDLWSRGGLQNYQEDIKRVGINYFTRPSYYRNMTVTQLGNHFAYLYSKPIAHYSLHENMPFVPILSQSLPFHYTSLRRISYPFIHASISLVVFRCSDQNFYKLIRLIFHLSHAPLA